MRAVALGLLALAALVFLAFPIVPLAGGWHGNVRLIGSLTCLGYVSLAAHTALARPRRLFVAALIGFLGAAAYGILVAVNITVFFDLQGSLLLFVLGAAGTAVLAVDRAGLASWFLWVTAAAWLVEGLASLASLGGTTGLMVLRWCDAAAAAGLVAAFVCALRKGADPDVATGT